MTTTQTALMISGIGMGAVFLVLGFLALIIKLMVAVFADKTSSPEGTAGGDKPKAKDVKLMAGGSGLLDSPAQDGPPGHIVGAISAVLASYLGPDARFRIASIKPAGGPDMAAFSRWALAGRLSQVGTRELFGFRRGL
jgi:Na+-transporting methylmalonyl-CoA/oxaloacetate decarboxylase gamma subunit